MWKLGLTAIWVASHTLQFGFGVGALNGIQDALVCSPGKASRRPDGYLEACIVMTPARFGLVVSVFTLGGLTGSLMAGWASRRWGLAGALRASAVNFLFGSLSISTANSSSTLLLGRVVVGIGCGLATVTVPLYLSEIAPASLKRSLGTLSQLFIVLGIFLAQLLALFWAKPYIWRYVMLVSAALSLVQLLSSFFATCPGNPARETMEERAHLLHTHEKIFTLAQLLYSRDTVVRRAFLLVITTQLFQQLCGISPVMYFSMSILTPLFGSNSSYIALTIVALKIPMTVLSTVLQERFGSRHMLLISSAAMSCSALALAIGMGLNSQIVSVGSIFAFVSAFSVGLGPVPWVVLPEVMPRRAVNAAGSLGLCLNWLTSFCMGASFLPLQHLISRVTDDGEGNIFYLFALFGGLGYLAIRKVYHQYELVVLELPEA